MTPSTLMHPLQTGACIELQVDRLSLGGDGVGRMGQYVVFVPYGCPGDLLEVEITETHRRYARARLLRVRQASPQRIVPPCPYHFQAPHPGASPELRVPSSELNPKPGTRNWKLFCGGCTWQQIAYPTQLEAKRQLVQETLERIGGFRGLKVSSIQGMQDPWRYRNKVQQPVGWDGRRIVSGFYAPSSHDIVPIEDCLVQSELSVRILNCARALLEQHHLQAYDEKRHTGWIRHFWIRTTAANQALLVFVTRTPEFPREHAVVEALVRDFPELVGVHQNVNPANTNVILGRSWRNICGADYLEERLGGLRFRLSPGSFFQVNSLQTEVLYNTVKQVAGSGEGVLDLYCGVGGIALWLAGRFEQVVGVDEGKGTVVDARQNARLNHISNVQFFAENAETFLQGFRHPNPSRDLTVIVDPPRAGCTPGVLKALTRLKPRNFIYVSCDPGTLARDLHQLGQGGFRLQTVQPVDLFPHTPHIETVVHLTIGR